jgi:Na+/H+-translocating membrane pyrophosphatase
MKTNKRLIAPATVLFGSMVAAVAFAMPAGAADSVYPPRTGTEVLGTSASTTTAAGASTTAASGELAFTGGAVVGLGALGGLLLVGGTTMVVASKRRKADA